MLRLLRNMLKQAKSLSCLRVCPHYRYRKRDISYKLFFEAQFC